MNQDKFIKELNNLDIEIDDKKLDQLEKYYEILIEKNKVMNLTAITERKDVYLKHFYDSLTLTKIVDLNEFLTVCDIGTGAGFPGIVLKIVFPHLKLVLIDALDKRVKFLNYVIEQLGLEDIKAVHDRIEIYSKNHKEEFDLVVSRAVAKTNVLLELGCQLPKKDGYFILMKGDIKEELVLSTKAIKELGYTISSKTEFNLPQEHSKRTLLKLKKQKQVSNKYPRDFSKIKKRPL